MYNGEKYFAYITKNNSYSFANLIGMIPEKEVFHGVYAQILFTIITGVILITVFGFVGLILSNTITKPILKVSNLLNEIAEGDGDLTQRLDIKTNDEIADVSKNFNVFSENLNKLISNIKKSSESLASTGSTLQSNMESTAAAVNEIAANVNSSSRLLIIRNQVLMKLQLL